MLKRVFLMAFLTSLLSVSALQTQASVLCHTKLTIRNPLNKPAHITVFSREKEFGSIILAPSDQFSLLIDYQFSKKIMSALENVCPFKLMEGEVVATEEGDIWFFDDGSDDFDKPIVKLSDATSKSLSEFYNLLLSKGLKTEDLDNEPTLFYVTVSLIEH